MPRRATLKEKTVYAWLAVEYGDKWVSSQSGFAEVTIAGWRRELYPQQKPKCKTPEGNLREVLSSVASPVAAEKPVAAASRTDTKSDSVSRSAPPSSMWEVEKIVNEGKCARHIWDREHLGIKEPFKNFPTVFSAVDKVMRAATDGKTVAEVLATDEEGRDDFDLLGEGVFRQIPGRLQSLVETDNGHRFTVRGELDTVVEHPNGMLTVVDFKHRPIGDREEMNTAANEYRAQLEAYAMLLTKQGKKVRGAAILWLGPSVDKLSTVCDVNNGKVDMDYDLMVSKVAINRKRYWELLDGYGNILEGERPPVSPDCDTCSYHESLAKHN